MDRVFGLLLHELSGTLASIGSEAQAAIVAARIALRDAYGEGPDFDAADYEISRHLTRMRAHQRTIGALVRASQVLDDAAGAAIYMHLQPTRLEAVARSAVESVADKTDPDRGPVTYRLTRSTSQRGVDVVCDPVFLQDALEQLLLTVARQSRRPTRTESSSVSIAFGINEQGAFLTVRGPVGAHVADDDSGPDGQRAATGPLDLRLLIAKRIIEAHDGALVSAGSPISNADASLTHAPHCEFELRWPARLPPGPTAYQRNGAPPSSSCPTPSPTRPD